MTPARPSSLTGLLAAAALALALLPAGADARSGCDPHHPPAHARGCLPLPPPADRGDLVSRALLPLFADGSLVRLFGAPAPELDPSAPDARELSTFADALLAPVFAGSPRAVRDAGAVQTGVVEKDGARATVTGTEAVDYSRQDPDSARGWLGERREAGADVGFTDAARAGKRVSTQDRKEEKVARCPSSDGKVPGTISTLISKSFSVDGQAAGYSIAGQSKIEGHVGADAHLESFDIETHVTVTSRASVGGAPAASRSYVVAVSTHVDLHGSQSPEDSSRRVGQALDQTEVRDAFGPHGRVGIVELLTDAGLDAALRAAGTTHTQATLRASSLLREAEHFFYDAAKCVKLTGKPKKEPIGRHEDAHLEVRSRSAQDGDAVRAKFKNKGSCQSRVSPDEDGPAGSTSITLKPEGGRGWRPRKTILPCVEVEALSKRGRGHDNFAVEVDEGRFNVSIQGTQTTDWTTDGQWVGDDYCSSGATRTGRQTVAFASSAPLQVRVYAYGGTARVVRPGGGPQQGVLWLDTDAKANRTLTREDHTQCVEAGRGGCEEGDCELLAPLDDCGDKRFDMLVELGLKDENVLRLMDNQFRPGYQACGNPSRYAARMLKDVTPLDWEDLLDSENDVIEVHGARTRPESSATTSGHWQSTLKATTRIDWTVKFERVSQ